MYRSGTVQLDPFKYDEVNDKPMPAGGGTDSIDSVSAFGPDALCQHSVQAIS